MTTNCDWLKRMTEEVNRTEMSSARLASGRHTRHNSPAYANTYSQRKQNLVKVGTKPCSAKSIPETSIHEIDKDASSDAACTVWLIWHGSVLEELCFWSTVIAEAESP